MSPSLLALLGLIGALVLVGGVVTRRVLASNLWALASSVQDDSFYYLLPAYNFKTLHFFSFDGVSHTSGFQPLYQILLAALALACPTLESMLRGALLLNLALHLATAAFVFAVVRATAREAAPMWRDLAALAAAWFYLSNPYQLLSATTAKENALASAMLALLLFQLARMPERGAAARGSARAAALLGLTSGGLLLARILPGTLVILGAALVYATRHVARWRSSVLWAGGLVLAWALYAGIAFGRLLPMSGSIKRIEGPYTVDPENVAGWLDVSLAAARYMAGAVGFALGLPNRFYLPQQDRALADVMPASAAARVALTLLALVPLLVAVVQRSRRHAVAPTARASGGLSRFLLALAVALPPCYLANYFLLRREGEGIYYFVWYIFDLVVLAPLLVGVGLARLPGALGARRRGWPKPHDAAAASTAGALALVCVLSLSALTVFRPFTTFVPSRSRWQDVVVQAGLWARDTLPLRAHDKVLAYNSGVLGFMLPGQVVNMDGLANDDVARLRLEGGDIVAYAVSTGARYMIDTNYRELFVDGRLTRWVIRKFAFPRGRQFFVSRLEAHNVAPQPLRQYLPHRRRRAH